HRGGAGRRLPRHAGSAGDALRRARHRHRQGQIHGLGAIARGDRLAEAAQAALGSPGPPQPRQALPGRARKMTEPIGRPKEITVLVLVAVTMFVTGTYVGVDWAAFFHPFQSRFQAGAGYARDILCAIIVVIAGRNRISTRDRRLLMAAFAL